MFVQSNTHRQLYIHIKLNTVSLMWLFGYTLKSEQVLSLKVIYQRIQILNIPFLIDVTRLPILTFFF